MRGFALPSDKQVCAKMFPHQEYIRERIERDGEDGVCSYNGMHGKVLPLSTIVDMVVSAFNEIFEDPANEIPFESHGIWDDLEGSGLHKEGAGYILPDDESQPLPVITLNQSQLISGIDSNPSQPNSGNDTSGVKWTICAFF